MHKILSENEKAKRFAFCKKYSNLEWRRVMFSDEVRKPAYTRCKVMFWIAITHKQMLRPVMILGPQTRHTYIKDCLTPVVKPYHDTYPNMIYQQDGAPAHMAKSVQTWFQDNNIETLKWPVNSPDLDILGDLWEILKAEIHCFNGIGAKHGEEMLSVINEAWDRISRTHPLLLEMLYKDMERRISECIKMKGGVIKNQFADKWINIIKNK